MAQLPIDVTDAEKEIKAQIAEKGLNFITSKMIRKHLEAKFNCHLDGFKDEIDAIIESSVSGTNATNSNAVKMENPETDTSASDSDLPLSTSNANNGKKKVGNSAKRRRTQTVDEMEADDDLASAVKRRRSANQTVPKKRAQKTKDLDKKATNNRKKNSAFSKICLISAELSTLLGKSYMRRSDVVKEMWTYFRSNNLLDPKNKQFVILDEPLKRVFGQKTRVKAFGMMSDLKKYVKDVALLDDAARRMAEADIAEILAMEERNNELKKEENDIEEKSEEKAQSHLGDTAGNSVGTNSSLSAESCGAVQHEQKPTTAQNMAKEQQKQMVKHESDESSTEDREEEEEDTGGESSSTDSDSD